MMSEFKKLDRVPSSDAEIRILIAPLVESVIEYNNIIMENTQESIKAGMERTKAELKKQGLGKSFESDMRFILNGSLKAFPITDIDFEEYSQEVSDRMKHDTFIASQGTVDRMSGDVMHNIKDSYEQGYGIDKAAGNLQDVFDDMEDWELKRVARTEINGAQNLGAEATMRQLGVQYCMWRTAGDARVRGNKPEDSADHKYLDGQITMVWGGRFSNGLTRPGDRNGPIKEWIQCRCVLLPYLMPEGYAAPSMSFFYVSDLIKVEIPEPKKIPKPGAKPKPITKPRVKPERIKKPSIPKEPKYYAETTKEAENYIEGKLKLDMADYSGLKLEYVNDINAKLVELKSKYPDISLKQIRAYNMGHPSRSGIMGSSSTYDSIEGTRGTLHINNQFFDKYNLSLDLKKKIGSSYKEGFATSKNLGDMVTHEMGHNIVLVKAKCGSEIQLMDFREIIQEKTGLKGISRYAESNFSESLAEAFVKYNRGDKLAPKIMKELYKYLGVK